MQNQYTSKFFTSIIFEQTVQVLYVYLLSTILKMGTSKGTPGKGSRTSTFGTSLHSISWEPQRNQKSEKCLQSNYMTRKYHLPQGQNSSSVDINILITQFQMVVYNVVITLRL